MPNIGALILPNLFSIQRLRPQTRASERAADYCFESLDLIILALEKGWDIAAALEIEEKMVSYVKGLTLKSEHMRKTFVPDFDCNVHDYDYDKRFD
jgi:hypothetical protein